MEIHQILPSIVPGDAVSNECLFMKEVLEEAGYTSNIYAENIHPVFSGKVDHFSKYRDSKEKIVIFHYSIGSNITKFVNNLKSKKILRYHNITPHEFFLGYNDQLAKLCNWGRQDLSRMAQYYTKCLCDSDFNRQELVALGFKNIDLMPILIDLDKFSNIEPNHDLEKTLEGTNNVVFVGKIAPHKSQIDLVKTFYYVKKYVNPEARLVLVGGWDGFEKYYEELKYHIDRLGLKDVVVTGKVPMSHLVAYYQKASVFLCASRHEGFCVPLVEAMHFKVPIVARMSTAIPFTLGNAGIMYRTENYPEIAELLGVILGDKKLRNQMVLTGQQRLKNFDPEQLRKQFLSTISKNIL